jgi:hypothetical protein
LNLHTCGAWALYMHSFMDNTVITKVNTRTHIFPLWHHHHEHSSRLTLIYIIIYLCEECFKPNLLKKWNTYFMSSIISVVSLKNLELLVTTASLPTTTSRDKDQPLRYDTSAYHNLLNLIMAITLQVVNTAIFDLTCSLALQGKQFLLMCIICYNRFWCGSLSISKISCSNV